MIVVTDEFVIADTDIPWKAIVAQRNIIAHEYGEILVERVWRVAVERIPELVEKLKPLIPQQPL